MAENNSFGFDETTYGVLILSSSESKSKALVKQILGTEELPEAKQFHEKVIGYPWHIETKYYVTDVYLFTLLQKDLINSGFAESLQSVVIYFDSGDARDFEYAKSWLPFVENYDADVLILVCENCSTEDSVVSKHSVLDWCLKNHFELVELCPTEDNDDDDFKETTGCKRIVQALHAHTWPNLTLKDNNGDMFPRLDDLQAILEENSIEPTENEDALFDALIGSGEGQDDDHFGTLLSSLHRMKEQAACLNGNERKRYAEQVAVAFWRVLGGDEDEIAGLSDDGDMLNEMSSPQ